MEHRSDPEMGELLSAISAGADLVEHELRVEKLAASLEEHFKGEEAQDGLFDWVESNAPNTHRTSTKLRREHSEFRAELSAISALTADLRRREQALVARLRNHERLECELLNKILYTDHGGGD